MGLHRKIQRGRGKKLRDTCRFRMRCYHVRGGKLSHTREQQSPLATATHCSKTKTTFISQEGNKVALLVPYIKFSRTDTQPDVITPKNPLPMILINVPEFGLERALSDLIVDC